MAFAKAGELARHAAGHLVGRRKALLPACGDHAVEVVAVAFALHSGVLQAGACVRLVSVEVGAPANPKDCVLVCVGHVVIERLELLSYLLMRWLRVETILADWRCYG